MHRPQVAAVICVVALLAGVVAGCGSSESTSTTDGSASTTPESAEGASIAFFSPIGANSYSAATLNAVEETASEHDATVKAFDAEFDQNKQIAQMEDAITSGQFDAFIVAPVNGAVLTNVTEEAIEAGIKVGANFNGIGPDLDSLEPQVEGLTTVVGQQMSTSGRLLGEAIVDGCAGIDPCAAIYMPGSFKIASEKIRLGALEEVVDQDPAIELIASTEGGYLPAPAYKAASDVLTVHGDANVFATSGDQMMTGIIKAVRNAQLLGDLTLIGNGATTEGVQWVREGIVAADPVTLPASEGRKVTELMIEALEGKQVPDSVDALSLSPIGDVATKESLDTPEGRKFKGEFSG